MARVIASYSDFVDHHGRDNLEVMGFFAMQEVVEGLWIGGEMAARNKTKLEEFGITHVLASNGSSPWFRTMGLKYLVLGLDDDEDEDIMKSFKESNEFIHDALSQRSRTGKGGVLVHCTAGRSRSATLVIAYLMQSKSMRLKDAHDLVKAARQWILPNPGFMQQLQLWERQLDLSPQATKGGEAETTPVSTCELCLLEERTQWLDASDERFVVILCDSCDLPMAVWRSHTNKVSPQDSADMMLALSRVADTVLGFGRWRLDTVQRMIPEHLHWHARPLQPSPPGLKKLLQQNKGGSSHQDGVAFQGSLVVHLSNVQRTSDSSHGQSTFPTQGHPFSESFEKVCEQVLDQLGTEKTSGVWILASFQAQFMQSGPFDRAQVVLDHIGFSSLRLSINFSHAKSNKPSEPVWSAKVVLVHLHPKTRRPLTLSPSFRDRVAETFDDSKRSKL